MTQTDLERPLDALVRDAVAREVRPLFAELQQFLGRRLAEISAEINAAVQLVDFSEANLTGQMTRIHDQVGRLLAAPARDTRNSGVELESVVQSTEEAAHRILEAAEVIGGWIGQATRAGSGPPPEVTEKLTAIYEACSFQDLTGQRVRRAIALLQSVESALAGVQGEGVQGEGDAGSVPVPPADDAVANPDLAQTEVDRLFG